MRWPKVRWPGKDEPIQQESLRLFGVEIEANRYVPRDLVYLLQGKAAMNRDTLNRALKRQRHARRWWWLAIYTHKSGEYLLPFGAEWRRALFGELVWWIFRFAMFIGVWEVQDGYTIASGRLSWPWRNAHLRDKRTTIVTRRRYRGSIWRTR